MLRNTLEWRASNHVDDEVFHSWREIIEHESCTGKMYFKGFDKEGHGILYMKPGKENSYDFEGNIKFLVFSMEATIQSMVNDGRQGMSYPSSWYLEY